MDKAALSSNVTFVLVQRRLGTLRLLFWALLYSWTTSLLVVEPCQPLNGVEHLQTGENSIYDETVDYQPICPWKVKNTLSTISRWTNHLSWELLQPVCNSPMGCQHSFHSFIPLGNTSKNINWRMDSQLRLQPFQSPSCYLVLILACRWWCCRKQAAGSACGSPRVMGCWQV